MAARGILGRKIGMTQVWDADHRVVPVTVIQAGPCRVVQLKTPERDGYAAVQLAFGATKPQRLSKPELGHLARGNGGPARHLAELRVNDLNGFEIGQVIAADVFEAGERVDVTGMSKGKGFAGVMKRHNFKGQGASHGNHKSHRAPGAIGACATPARVFKGMRMAGQQGDQRVTTQNLEVVDGDAERGLLLVRGSVPGANGSIVFVRTSVKGAGTPHPVLPVVEAPPEAAEPEVIEDPQVEEAEPDAPQPEAASDDAPEAEAAADEPDAATDESPEEQS